MFQADADLGTTQPTKISGKEALISLLRNLHPRIIVHSFAIATNDLTMEQRLKSVDAQHFLSGNQAKTLERMSMKRLKVISRSVTACVKQNCSIQLNSSQRLERAVMYSTRSC